MSSLTKQLADPDALLAAGKNLLDHFPATPALTQQRKSESDV